MPLLVGSHFPEAMCEKTIIYSSYQKHPPVLWGSFRFLRMLVPRMSPPKPSQTIPKIRFNSSSNILMSSREFQRCQKSQGHHGHHLGLQTTRTPKRCHGLVQRLAQRCHLCPGSFRCQGFAPGPMDVWHGFCLGFVGEIPTK